MIFSLRRMAGWAKFLTKFVILTLVLYQLIAWVSHWLEPVHRYGEPKGPAVKVFASHGDAGAGGGLTDIKQRLLLFYWLGE
ncbi:MAG: DUF4227 family protein [Firmicutes bacterium]|uniref:DUF4227 family protein n=1 Tax=Melghirimyces thermohalophilus TaxID=1236220 RepID=A0A1G6LN09_9BACL|nr:DUF4227 family protein [Melghirimyces thermohalophilus]MDA8353277.1 DUF4227 family protein [Bacillota bacterium]SDC44125.1 Protein of unknown function [Melghirimyces thermohalophilus]